MGLVDVRKKRWESFFKESAEPEQSTRNTTDHPAQRPTSGNG